MIKEAGCDDHAAFLIDNGEAPLADPLVDAVKPQFELGFAPWEMAAAPWVPLVVLMPFSLR